MACALVESDFSNFDCSRFCDSFCKTTKNTKQQETNFGYRLSDLYPGLTDAEKRFVDKNPQVALKAYWLSWRAERVCGQIYLRSDTNDESDACRHFMWASLLNVAFGQTVASEILDAHEQNSDEPEKERSMDLANNRRGLIVSIEMLKSKRTSDSDFLIQFKKDLIDGKLVVLKRRSK